MTMSGNQIMEMRRILVGWSVRHFKITQDLAEDAVSHAICGALEMGGVSHSYCSVAVRNYVYVYWRNRATRNENYAPPLGEEGDPIEFADAAVLPTQLLTIEAIECINAIESMPADVVPVMRYLAVGYTTEEIAKVLGLPEKLVKQLTASGRQILRDRDGYEIERKKGHHQFIGIRKRCRIWEARIKVGEKDEIIGYFKTASEAAKAFDERAVEIRGDDTRTNFTNKKTKTIRDAVKISGRSPGWLTRNRCTACDKALIDVLRFDCGSVGEKCDPTSKDFGVSGTWGKPKVSSGEAMKMPPDFSNAEASQSVDVKPES